MSWTPPEELAPADRWDDSKSNPRDDMKRGAMAMGASEREAEIFIECLMGKRKYDIDLHFDLNSGKLRRSLEKSSDIENRKSGVE